MIVRRFLEWVRTASAEERAEGASALARAFLYSDLDDADQHAAEAALTCLVEDASPLVRPALADYTLTAHQSYSAVLPAALAVQSPSKSKLKYWKAS